MAKPPKPRWWTIRTASNRKPATYRCPLCGNQLPSLQPHMLITPEGDASRRRHAHSACVIAARSQGQLPTQAEWRAAARTESDLNAPTGILARLRGRLRRSGRQVRSN